LKRIAFFVEGYTERLFIEKILQSFFTKKDLSLKISTIRGNGDKTDKVNITDIRVDEQSDVCKYYILIYDCGGDKAVKSFILNQRESLIKSGYSLIIGFLDLYPNFGRHELVNYKKGLHYRLPTKDLTIRFIISVMEIETWFLAEHTHFPRIDSGLNNASIHTHFPFNPETDDMELRDTPSIDLHNIYQLVGKNYLVADKKTGETILRTIEAIDFDRLIIDVAPNYNSLQELITELENF
jgi:hypothetical protein